MDGTWIATNWLRLVFVCFLIVLELVAIRLAIEVIILLKKKRKDPSDSNNVSVKVTWLLIMACAIAAGLLLMSFFAK